jgi:predicted MFS family arabinose efflux permease
MAAEPTLRTRSMGLLVLARLVINTAHRLVYPFLPVIARGLGISLNQAGTMVSVRWAASLATPGVVHVVDHGRRPRRLIAVGLVMFVIGAVVTVATNVYIGALAGFALMGLAKSAYDISAQAYVSDRVPYARRSRYLGILELTWAGAFLLGAPAAGWLIERGGWELPFWVVAGLLTVALLVLPLFLNADVDHIAGPSPALKLDTSALSLLVVMGLFTGGAELVFVVMGAWLEDAFGLSLLALGGVALILGIAELTGEGTVVAFTDRIGKRRSVAIGMVIAAVAFALMALAEDQLALGVALLAVALGGFEFTIVSSYPLASEVRPLARVKYLSLTVVSMGFGRAIGAFAGPRLFEVGGLPAPVLGAALANLVGLAVLLAFVHDRGNRPDDPVFDATGILMAE